MAHVLHDGHHHDDGCDCSGSGGREEAERERAHRRRHHRRREHLIPVGTISIDCAPVSFHTPGQARNLLICPVPLTGVNVAMCPPLGTELNCAPVTSTRPCGCW